MMLLVRLGFDVTQRFVEPLPPRFCLVPAHMSWAAISKPMCVSQSRIFPCVSGSRPLCLVAFVQDADMYGIVYGKRM